MEVQVYPENGIKYLETITDFENVTAAKIVKSNCISICFVNKGSNSVNINGLVLAQNESFKVSQEVRQIDRTQYRVYFLSDGSESNLVVIKTSPKNQHGGN